MFFGIEYTKSKYIILETDSLEEAFSDLKYHESDSVEIHSADVWDDSECIWKDAYDYDYNDE